MPDRFGGLGREFGVIGQEFANEDGSSAVEGVDEGGAVRGVDETEEVAGVVDAVDGKTKALGNQEIDDGESEGIALFFFEAPGEIGIPRVKGGVAVAGKAVGIEKPGGEAKRGRDVGLRFLGEKVEFVREAGAEGDAVVEEVGNEAEEGLEGFVIAIGILEASDGHDPVVLQLLLTTGVEGGRKELCFLRFEVDPKSGQVIRGVAFEFEKGTLDPLLDFLVFVIEEFEKRTEMGGGGHDDLR